MQRSKSLAPLFVMISSISLGSPQAWAICEKESSEYDHFRKLCDQYSGCSQATSWTIVGGLLCGAVAQNQCRIRDEKLSNLHRCLKEDADAKLAEAERVLKEAELKEQEAEKARVEALRQAERTARATQINTEFENRRTELQTAAQHELEDYVRSLLNAGLDPSMPEVGQLISSRRAEIEKVLFEKLQTLEVERQRQLKAI